VHVLYVWGPPIAVMALIFAASSTTAPAPAPEFLSDKVLHMAGYAALGFLVLRALADGRLARVTWRLALMAFVLTVLYGVSDELHQAFVPGRTPELMDVVADGAGAVIGICALGALSEFLRGKGRRARAAK